MKENKSFRVGLLGNPNSGKSSLFNQLTGLKQHIGNFPGVTVEKKEGKTTLNNGQEISIIDFPGTYSLHPTTLDERVVLNVIANPDAQFYPDAILYVADVTNIEKHLLLFTQLQDIGFPMLMALTMSDVAEQKNVEVDIKKLEKTLGTTIVLVSNRTGKGFDNLKNEIEKLVENTEIFATQPFYQNFSKKEKQLIQATRQQFPYIKNDYQAFLWYHHADKLPFLKNEEKKTLQQLIEDNKAEYKPLKGRIDETLNRFDKFTPLVQQFIKTPSAHPNSLTDKVDRIVMHKAWGPLIFFLLMLLVFQSIFTWSSIPMGWIEMGFGALSNFLNNSLPAGWLTDLFINGIVAGLSGVLVFIPQIAILFFLISILEEIGYMARAVFMFDKIMQRFGLNGRSIVALISGGACAIPAVMSTRTISNWKERLITIMVTPLISCSARLPVYVILIGFVVPSFSVLGIFNSQALVFMSLYILGIVAALGSAFVFHKILKSTERSFLMIQLPEYQRPQFKNIGLNVYEKVKSFTLEAGKIIMIISIILWVLGGFGPAQKMENAKLEAQNTAQIQNLSDTATQDLIASKQLEASFAGHIGKFIEPAIRPLGFDWKIGIALISSFAAREVFVGTMATIYSIESASEDNKTLRQRMQAQVYADGSPVYTMATALSLLLFYVFAMQCMATLAVVKRETRSWKWPIIQFLFMGGLAYLSSLAVYQLLG